MRRVRNMGTSIVGRAAAVAVSAVVAVASLTLADGAVSRADTGSPQGVDIASYQHPNGAPIDWNAYAGSGRPFVFIKATESNNYINPYFAGDWRDSTAAGVLHSAYHFARPALPLSTATDQATYFVNAVGRVKERGELPPVLDLEVDGGLSTTNLVAWTKQWLTTVQRLTGVTPIIYSYPYFWQTSMGNTTAFDGYPLWIASYGTSSPAMFGGWSQWTFWQYGDQGTVPGINGNGNVDLDSFNGSALQLQALALGPIYPIDPSLVGYWSSSGGTSTLGAAISAPYAVGDGIGQDFTRGSLFTSPSVGDHMLVGAIRNHYLAIGGPALLGLPTAEESDGGVSGSRMSTFQHGRIYWSHTTGAYSVSRGILSEYLAAGGPPVLGLPIADESDGGVPGARVSVFQNGRVYWSHDTSAHVVTGDILTKYLALGGPSAVGLPTADPTDAGVSGAQVSVFQGGRIYSSATTGPHLVLGGILGDYLSLGGPAAVGLPTTDETDAGVPGGRMSVFEHGRIYWSHGTGTHGVYGGILVRYLSLGGPQALGLPMADEADAGVPGGRVSVFQHGRVYWSHATGAHGVVGGILSRYLQSGGPAVLGLPTADEASGGVAGSRMSVFERGRVYWSHTTGAHAVIGAILGKYVDVGAASGRLGLPTAEQATIRGGTSQSFVHGRITAASSGATSVSYSS